MDKLSARAIGLNVDGRTDRPKPQLFELEFCGHMGYTTGVCAICHVITEGARVAPHFGPPDPSTKVRKRAPFLVGPWEIRDFV